MKKLILSLLIIVPLFVNAQVGTDTVGVFSIGGKTIYLTQTQLFNSNEYRTKEISDGGVWTPNLTNTLNIDASVAYDCNYQRIGNTVVFSGRVDVDPTAASGILLGMSLPIASNFTAAQNAGGAGAISTNVAVPIYADTANDRLIFAYTPTNTTSEPIHFSGVYRILP